LSFPVYGEKINLAHFRPVLRLGVNLENWARKFGGKIILYGEFEKVGPMMICRPSRFQLMRFTLTTTLK
jgi:hypothetical protein